MNHNKYCIKESAARYAAKIFESKDDFHKEQAKLPIEEKIEILIELQKIVLNSQKDNHTDELRRVWRLE